MYYFEELRKHYKISVNRLCKATGITRREYARYLLHQNPTLNTVTTLADFYELTGEEFNCYVFNSPLRRKVKQMDSAERKKAIQNKLSLAGR